eukprot:436666_1
MWFKIKTITLWITLYHSINAENMNGLYNVASGAKQNVPFNTDYSTKNMEYFDVWAPEIATHYGDVFWHDQHDQPLPDHIVKRFAGKVIAITGYEQDQVMVLPPGQPGVNPSQDISVPINWAYNHHYMAWMTGNYSIMKKVPTTDADIWYNHGMSYKWVPEPTPQAAFRNDPNIPVSQFISEGNGGESRKSYHGYPNHFAQLIESPQTWHITPMQIDTRNRECGANYTDINNCTQFIPGIEPLQSRYGRGIPKGTNYSGLLECPCDGKFGGDAIFYGNDTKTKQVTHNYVTLQTTQCSPGETISSSNECFNAVSNMGFLSDTKIVNKITDSSDIPIGCTISYDNQTNIIYADYNNAITSKTKCSTANVMTGNTQSDIGIELSLSLDTSVGNITFVHSPVGEYCSENHNNVLAKFPSASSNESDQKIALNKCENYCMTDSECNVCSVDCPGSNLCQWVAIPQCGNVEHYNAPAYSLIPGDISYKQGAGLINITISGPNDVWFGIGFNAVAMNDQPYVIVINSTDVWEQKIGTCGSEADHCPGIRLNKTIKLLSNTVNGNIRTVIVQRSASGATDDYYTFNPSVQSTINLITAIGESQTFAYHKAHSNAQISFIMSTGNTCVCDTGANGKLCQPDGTQCKTFVKNCVAASINGSLPWGQLVSQDNPTCNSRQYSGGLSCCRDGHNLLDADQEIPTELLKYHMKFRFWFQEYYAANSSNGNVPSHYNLPRIYVQTEAWASEYDIPPAYPLPNLPIVGYPNWPVNQPTPGTTCTGNCPNGTDCQCIHEIQYKWAVPQPTRLIYVSGHCHAPACISLTLYRNDTGEILCQEIPQYGKGNVKEDKFDEAGYILIPPCLFGDDKGLEPSVLLPKGTPLLSIKKNRNTHIGHFGEMASWQMRGVYF